MAVSGIDNSSNSTTGSTPPPGSERVPKKTLGQEDFFQLLAVQFASQDPLKPMDDTSFIAEMANFTALENSKQLAGAFNQFATQQDFSAAQSLLGRNVTILDDNDTEVVGLVSSVRNDGEGTLITVNGADYAVGSVRRVELPGTAEQAQSTGN